MSKKYIKQITSNNFIYPNNELYEYDTEIIHDINNNMVSGNVTNFAVTYTNNNQSLVISFDYSWALNSAEPSFLKNGQLSVLSLHMMTSTQKYFKPWQCIYNVSSSSTSAQTLTGTTSTTIDFGQVMPQGDYTFEFRFIAHRCIFPIVANYTATYPATPTPTPTSTPGLPAATPTPTPTLNPCTLAGTAVYVS